MKEEEKKMSWNKFGDECILFSLFFIQSIQVMNEEQKGTSSFI
jgi:hypothetical protein